MSVGVGESLAGVSGVLEDLRGSLPALADAEIVQVVRDLEALSRRTQSVLLDVVAEAEARAIAAHEGFGSTARMLSAVVRISGGQARTRVQQAGLLAPRRSLTGETLPPLLPATATALAAGQVGDGQVRVITEAMAVLPSSVPESVRAQMETDLVRYAKDFDPRRLRLLATRMLAHLHPDGPAPDPDDPDPGLAAPKRGELWLRERRDGRLGLDGWLAPEHGTVFRALIEQLAAPHPAVDGLRDQRSTPTRQADALIELTDRARTAPDAPTTAGEPPHLNVLIDWEALRTGLGSASLDYGQPLSAAEARRLACDCTVIPLVLGAESEPLDIGRASRTVPRAIRRAVAARDRMCCFPGCHRPPQRCDVHHARHWIDGGVTAVGNCCLLCPTHHQQIHLQGWDLTIQGGRVTLRPPTTIDPDRRPLTNPLRT